MPPPDLFTAQLYHSPFVVANNVPLIYPQPTFPGPPWGQHQEGRVIPSSLQHSVCWGKLGGRRVTHSPCLSLFAV